MDKKPNDLNKIDATLKRREPVLRDDPTFHKPFPDEPKAATPVIPEGVRG